MNISKEFKALFKELPVSKNYRFYRYLGHDIRQKVISYGPQLTLHLLNVVSHRNLDKTVDHWKAEISNFSTQILLRTRRLKKWAGFSGGEIFEMLYDESDRGSLIKSYAKKWGSSPTEEAVDAAILALKALSDAISRGSRSELDSTVESL